MFVGRPFFLCLIICSFLQLSSVTSHSWGGDKRRTTTETHQLEGYEEVTLVADKNVFSFHGWGDWKDWRLWRFWKRQSGGLQTNTATPETPSQNGSSLTTSITANNSGAAGNNTDGQAPGVIGVAGNPNSRYVDCMDTSTGFSEKCWNELNLTDYVNDWLRHATCFASEGFASCFLRQNKLQTIHCIQISTTACSPPQSPSLIDDPKALYVAYNIWGKQTEHSAVSLLSNFRI